MAYSVIGKGVNRISFVPATTAARYDDDDDSCSYRDCCVPFSRLVSLPVSPVTMYIYVVYVVI